MSDIPLAEKKLKDAMKLLREALKLMPREKPVKRAKPKATPMTRQLAKRIIRYAERFPGLSNRELGRVFNVDGGRVSEALTGKKWK